jgi:hypothetical protein
MNEDAHLADAAVPVGVLGLKAMDFPEGPVEIGVGVVDASPDMDADTSPSHKQDTQENGNLSGGH